MSINFVAAVLIGIFGLTDLTLASFPDLDALQFSRTVPAVVAVHTEVASVSVPTAPLIGQTTLGVFQSVAISAARLPAAAKWHEVKRSDYRGLFAEDCAQKGFDVCDTRLVSRVRAATGRAAGQGEREMLDVVNRAVNGAMNYRDDSRIWGASDYWATPTEMARKGAGDCEDFAIAKYWALRSLGLADEQLQIVVLQDTRRQLFHAVLVAHIGSGSYVLDNVSNRLAEDSSYGQYQPIMSFAGTKNYIHGFAAGRTDLAALPGDLSAVSPGSGI